MNKPQKRILSALTIAALSLTSYTTISRADSGSSEPIPVGTEVATLDHSYQSASASNNVREFQYEDGVTNRPTSGIEKMPVRNRAVTSHAPIAGTILYHPGGPVLTSVNIYTIWYGSSAAHGSACAPTPTGDAAVLNPMLRAIGTSPWYSTNTRYYSLSGSTQSNVTNVVNYPTGASNCTFVDSSTYGTSLEGASSRFTTSGATLKGATSITLTSTTGLTVGRAVSGTGIAASTVITAVDAVAKSVTLSAATTAAIATSKSLTVAAPSTQMIVDNVIRAGTFAADSAGLYFVFTDPSVTVSGFGTSFCGYHGYFTPTTGTAPVVQYSFVGNPNKYMTGCAAQTTSPNGSAPADAMASVTAHELVEAVSDPLLNAWFDSAGNENADKCAWVFGTTTPSGAGSANVTIGSANYLIQQNWDPLLSGCYSAAAPLPPLTASVSTSAVKLLVGTAANAKPVTASGGTGAYTYSISPALTNGLTFNTSTGTIGGTPAVALVSPLTETITVTAAGGGSVTGLAFTIDVKAALSSALTAPSITFTHGVAATSTVAQSVTGGYAPYTYSISRPPTGVTINSSTGLITATTSTVATAAKNYTVTVKDSANFSKTYTLSITIL